jgi:hypothetical protein
MVIGIIHIGGGHWPIEIMGIKERKDRVVSGNGD